MVLIAWRDLQFRRRRFVISVVAVALVLAMTLLLSGLANFFTVEVDRTLDHLDVDTWVVADGATGPFLGAAPMLDTAADDLAGQPDVESVGPMAYRTLKVDDDAKTSVNVFGVSWGEAGAPEPAEGRAPAASGEVVADVGLGIGLDEEVVIAGQPVTVVGLVHGSTALAGSPNVFMAVPDAQKLGFAGQPVISAIAVRGEIDEVPEQMVVLGRDDARDDFLQPLSDAAGTIAMVTVLLWIVAACIIGSVIYLSALERVGDFAVLKATGTSSRWVLGSLVIQAVLLALVASALAMVLSLPLAPLMPMPAEVPVSSLIGLPVTAVAVSLVASVAGVRRAVAVDPAMAFG